MTETQRAYIAGIFDGEGCVTWRRGRTPFLQITQKDREILDWIREVTGVGNVYLCGGRFHVLSIGNAADIQKFVEIVYPYSRIKRSLLKKAYHHKYRQRRLRHR